MTCLRQVEKGMNEVREAIITAITPNGSAALPFVIPRGRDFLFFRIFDAPNHNVL